MTLHVIHNHLELETGPGINLHDITPRLRQLIAECGLANGLLTVTSRHTTTALTINENEERLLEDVRGFFAKLVPADATYLHNDIQLRDCSPDEPENAHAHLVAILLGSSEAVPVVDGALDLGRWQSVMLVELDGPRRRTVGVQVIGV